MRPGLMAGRPGCQDYRLPTLSTPYGENVQLSGRGRLRSGSTGAASVTAPVKCCGRRLRPLFRPKVKAATVLHTVNETGSDIVRAVSKATRVSPFVVLMCATDMAITRVSGQQELIVGVDTANRDDEMLANIIGFFLNTRLVRVASKPDDRLVDVVRSVRDCWYESAAYDHVYYDQVVSALGEREITGINMPSLSPGFWRQFQGPKLRGVEVSEVETGIGQYSWRNLVGRLAS